MKNNREIGDTDDGLGRVGDGAVRGEGDLHFELEGLDVLGLAVLVLHELLLGLLGHEVEAHQRREASLLGQHDHVVEQERIVVRFLVGADLRVA